MKSIRFNTINVFLILLLTIISISCVSTRTLTIEIPQQGNKELPESIQSLLLVTRTVDNRYTDLESDSLQKIFYMQNFDLDTAVYDLQAVDTTLKALGELLFESGRYDFVIPENRFLDFKRNSFINSEMEWEEVRELCTTYNTDAILSIDHYKTQVKTEYSQESFFNPLSDGFVKASYADMQIIYEALFRVYDPAQEKVLIREFMRDTISWEDMDRSASDLFSHFTPVKEALSEAGIAMALDFSEKISTIWRESSRQLFFKGDPLLKQSEQMVDSGNWESAMALWKELAESTKSKSVRSKAEFNTATGYELQGDINNAIEWALRSYNTMYRPITYNYLEILKRRRNELQKQQQ
jgi:hypothetical protein